MPGEHGFWRDEERCPSFSRYETGEEGDECPIRPGEAGTSDLPAQHDELMTEYENLGVFGHGFHLMHAVGLEYVTRQAVEDESHTVGEPARAYRGWSSRCRVLGPFRIPWCIAATCLERKCRLATTTTRRPSRFLLLVRRHGERQGCERSAVRCTAGQGGQIAHASPLIGSFPLPPRKTKTRQSEHMCSGDHDPLRVSHAEQYAVL
jgi:hypothetical protein